MFCNKCGKELMDGAAFCAFCGEPVKIQESNAPELLPHLDFEAELMKELEEQGVNENPTNSGLNKTEDFNEKREASACCYYEGGKLYRMPKNGCKRVGDYLYYYFTKTDFGKPCIFKATDASGNIEETKGYVVARINLVTGDREILAKVKSEFSHSLNEDTDCFRYDNKGGRIAVYDDKIYYVDGQKVMCIDLDGSNSHQVAGWAKKHGDNLIKRLFVCKKGIIIPGEGKITYGGFDMNDQKEEMNIKGEIVSVSDDEIVAGDEIINPWERIREKIEKVYPSAKGKYMLFIDSDRGIAYHMDEALNESRDWYSKGRQEMMGRSVIGTDKSGKVVDEWKIPNYPDRNPRGHSSLSFNGRRLIMKWTSYLCENGTSRDYIAEYDKSGNEIRILDTGKTMEVSNLSDEYEDYSGDYQATGTLWGFGAICGDIYGYLKRPGGRFENDWQCIATVEGKSWPISYY